MFFSGFSLTNESELFQDYIIRNDFTASAFSYGCIKLVENIINGTYKSEYLKKRIDKIQLFSPAFFNDKDKKYIRVQLMFFKKDSKQYCENFLENCGFTSEQKEKYFAEGTYLELQELLEYKWNKKVLQYILDKGIKIEVYLGEKDKIIDSSKALEFFKSFGEVYFIKEKNHIL